MNDLKYAIRMMLKRPGFTLIALLTLALGIGANTAIFSLVNTVLLRPFPVANPDQLMSTAVAGKDDSMQAFSYPAYEDFRDRNEVFSGFYATRMAPMSLSRDGANERVWGYLVTGNYFEVLGVGAHIGRAITSEDDRQKLAHPVAVLSHGFWQRRFGSDSSVVGRDVLLNGHPFRVIGVAPEGFIGTEMIYVPDIWVPMMMQPWIEPGNEWLDRRGTQNIFATGRLKPGVSRAQAEAALNVIAAQLAAEHPQDEEGKTITLIPPGFILPSVRGAFISFAAVLMATVALVLLIVCVNLANLLLARATERKREIAIRLAVGASRWRLIRQLLVENLALALAGGAAGLLTAGWIIDAFESFKPPLSLPLTLELTLDWRVTLFSIAVSVITSALFGLAPALQATSADLVPALKDVSLQLGLSRSRLRRALVVAQVAVSFILLVSAGLVVRALQSVQTVNPGFEIENGLIVSFDLGLQGYDQARGRQFQHQLVERVRAIPGVENASLTDLFPLSLNYSSNGVHVEGHEPQRGANIPTAMVASVGGNYFSTMRIPMVAGRAFTEQDDEHSTRVVVVNEALVRRFIPEAGSMEEALGRRISFAGADGPYLQIAGVARDGKYWTIGEAPQPFVYSPLRQSYNGSIHLIVRATSDPRALIGAIRNEAQKLDANLPLYDIKTFSEHLSLSLFPARVAATLLGSFAVVALALAAMGIYGVTSYSVSQRTREIGIRLALGARPADVLRMVVGQSSRLAAAGLLIGLVSAFLLTRLMEGLLYGVSATDPVTFAAIVALLALVALVACFIPARRASKVDPQVALRYE
jgi:predicted permease